VLAAVAAGLEAGIEEFIVPAENAGEAAILSQAKNPGKRGARISAAASLREAVHALFLRAETGKLPVSVPSEGGGMTSTISTAGDFAHVRGQGRYKRALEIAAAGGHNLLVFGPPGAGKTMLARQLPSILPPLTPEEAVEVTRLHSLAGPFKNGSGFEGFIGGLISHPPFRSPHHSASAEGILGGGKTVRPGEISLAHYGVLFLDEAPEFRSNVLQALREPLEDRVISIVRAEGPVRLPAEFQLLLAANSCPCGRLGMRDPGSDEDETGGPAPGCFCSPEEIHRHWRKFGAALLDRVELRVAVIPPKIQEMGGDGESSAIIASRVRAAVDIQRRRFQGTGIRRNALIPAGMIAVICPLNQGAQQAFHKALARLGLSGRAYHSILRVARTIADLEGKDSIDTVHIREAVQHRRQGEDPYEILSAGE
jgi:magnesium chelatase family protein